MRTDAPCHSEPSARPADASSTRSGAAVSRGPAGTTAGHGARYAAEDGVAAGAEAVVLGALVFITGMLVLVSMWTLVDAKLAVEAAAREATRAVVEAPADIIVGGSENPAVAQAVARDAAVAAMTAQRGAPDTGTASWSLVDISVTGTYERCGSIEAVVRVTVDTPRLPFVGRRLTAGTLEGSHLERIEPYRAGLPVPAGGITC